MARFRRDVLPGGFDDVARKGFRLADTLNGISALDHASRGASGYGPGEAPQWDDYSKCIHCGLCLNSCPTYRVLHVEMDSPRGRIYQMIQVDHGRLLLADSFVRHMDLCLDCRACETACPSGVNYGRLIEAARGQIERHYKRPWKASFLRRAFYRGLLPYPRRLAAAGWILRAWQRSGAERALRASGALRLARVESVARLAPRMDKPFFFGRLGMTFPATGPRRARVALLAGCIAQVAFARLNDATIRVLTRNGCEVVVPREQGCCAALHVHAGMRNLARLMALKNIRAFASGSYDAIITNAAGCGSVLKDYPELFEQVDRDHLEEARAFSAKVKDVTEFLAELGLRGELAAVRARVTYQDPCHLCHAQGIRSAPRALIGAIPGVEFAELRDAEVCCGSAGVYNVIHNDVASRLLDAKMKCVDDTRAGIILTANPGCMIQLQAGVAASSNPNRRVLHVVELLDESYRMSGTK